VALARLAETREPPRPAVLGHRELVIEVAALVAWIRAYQAGETVVAMVAFGLLMPLVMAIRRIRLGAGSPRLLGRRAWALQSANFWFFLVLLAAASLPGTFDVWRVYAPDAQALVVGASGPAWRRPSSSPFLVDASPRPPTGWPCCDSGNSDEPHLHIQVQNKPTFDVEDRATRTYPILFDGATASDLRRGDSVQPLA
jgi:hypothetical protein